MLANSKPLSLFKEGFRNRILIASLMRSLNVLHSDKLLLDKLLVTTDCKHSELLHLSLFALGQTFEMSASVSLLLRQVVIQLSE